MNYLRLLSLWLQVELRARGVQRVRGAAGRSCLSLALPVRSVGSKLGTAALSWSASDPLAVHVSYLARAGCVDRVVAREALRTAPVRGLHLDLALGQGGATIRLPRRGVRRFVWATDAVVPRDDEARAAGFAADAFLESVVHS